MRTKSCNWEDQEDCCVDRFLRILQAPCYSVDSKKRMGVKTNSKSEQNYNKTMSLLPTCITSLSTDSK